MFEFGPNDTAEDGIYIGDAMELAKDIPDESIDMILTDPVYDRIDDYRWVAELGARVLKPGGNLLVQTGQYHLPMVVKAMDGVLDYIWIIAEKLWGHSAGLYKHKIIVCWKPYLWYAKGRRNGEWVLDWILSGGKEKTLHKWGDSPQMFISLIERLTDDGGVVLDPFTGSGTVPAACVAVGRKYLAFEIDPEMAQVARQRVKNVQPKLPIKVDIQPELFAAID